MIVHLRCFKSCPRVGGIKSSGRRGRIHPGFKSCPRVGGIILIMHGFACRPSFKSCPRVGGIPDAFSHGFGMIMFQVVPPCGGHLVPIRHLHSCFEFQVVPPCGGHPMRCCRSSASFRVSSRAPVWGASWDTTYQRRAHQRFKSCPRVGGIQYNSGVLTVCALFQVVPPCGGHLQAVLGDPVMKKFQVVPPCGGHQNSE